VWKGFFLFVWLYYILKLGVLIECAYPHAADCLDLLHKMLLPDPEQRIKMDEIIPHPWFVTNLPPEASTMNLTYLKAPLPSGRSSMMLMSFLDCG
jgi:hypothetical protein